MGSKAKVNYVNEADLKEDVRILYETGQFPDRLARNLQEMVNRICESKRFGGYTDDWKAEMKGAAIMALIKTLNEKRYDPNRPNTKFFSWASKVIFNQFYMWLVKRRNQLKHEEVVKNQLIVDDRTFTKGGDQ